MKKQIAIFALLTMMAFATAQSQKVYVTANGKKYHDRSCRTIQNSNVTELTLEQAKAMGYTPCKICGG